MGSVSQQSVTPPITPTPHHTVCVCVCDVCDAENTTICAESLTVIPSGAGTARCPYCGTVVKAEFAGKLCPSCQLCRIGAKVPRSGGHTHRERGRRIHRLAGVRCVVCLVQTLGMQFRPLLRKYVR